jgi:DNA primase
MSRIPDETIEQVRDSADIVGLIGESVQLKRTGTDYRGSCPFHGGTHRNFAVIPKKGRYYCFVCHESGDVFSWLMKRLGFDYPTAVREVARRVGIVIPENQSSVTSDPREPLFQALAMAQDWYAKQLLEEPKAATARDYLESREISLSTAGELGLGFAPPGRAFQDAMKVYRIEEPHLIEAGLLFKREDGSTAPRFRSRLLFPIHDLRGRAVGFGGRILVDAQPKYLNSPETPVFRKGTLLYNLHLAKHAIRKETTAIVVEGYFDAIRLVLAGMENVVASLGTAMTADQAGLLTRFAKTVILLYDSDQAGLKASFRSSDELLRQGARVQIATLPPGEDPDTIVRQKGIDALTSVMSDSVDPIERKLQVLTQHGWLETFEHRRSALDKLLPTIRAAKDPITRDMYLSLVSARTEVSKEVLARELDLLPALTVQMPQSGVLTRTSKSAASESDPWKSPGLVAERNLIYILLTSPMWFERALDEVSAEWFRCSEYGEVFSALANSKVESEPFDIQRLSARAQLASNLLRNRETFLGLDVDLTYVASCSSLKARPLVEAFKEQRARLRSERDEAKRDELIFEVCRLRDEILEHYPLEWVKHTLRKGFTVPRPGRSTPDRIVVTPSPGARRNVS